MGDRAITIGRDMVGSSAITGNQNVAYTTYRATLPPAEGVDIRAEVSALREFLSALGSPEQAKLEHALADAQEEVSKPEPDRDELGGALERAIKYAKQANGFADQVQKLKPHLEAACSWLGQNWHKLLAATGLNAAL
jgi:hypothetical protein